jgi:GTP-sensing pleiotropic transcriptional regulator CodY
MKNIKKDKDVVDGFVSTLSRLNFEQFEKSLSNLDDVDANVYTSKIKDKVEEFLTKLNKTSYAIR